MSKNIQEVFWNGNLVGYVRDPSVDNFDFYGQWEPVEDAVYSDFLQAVDEDGDTMVEVGEIGSKLKGSVEIEPEEEFEMKIRV